MKCNKSNIIIKYKRNNKKTDKSTTGVNSFFRTPGF